MKRRILLNILLIFFAQASYGETNQSSAQLSIEVLDSFCVQNFDDFSKIENMRKAFKAQILPISITEQDLALSRMGGKAFAIRYGGTEYTIGYANNGGCTVLTENVNHEHLPWLIEKLYQAKLMHTDTHDGRVSSIFYVTEHPIHKGAMIYLGYDQTAKDSTVSVGFLPAKIANQVRNQ